VECSTGGLTVARWEFVEANCQGEVVVELPGSSSRLTCDLTFHNLNPKSPQELGLSDDVRRIGIGIAQVRLL
jgi:hypothetical protein